eukprot:CAMPEP_0119021232 /NCGR_PEP_ID=MMETSP1176-20130426/25577_1 /TAXON_ID=265551 /ORGANISM="Synedropsis recta cf, Strain CCMP1620" /LENGTH=289 /DNA_ID=CAMNT_0006975793 /DNA_START=32 /DNA_END=901 /DNA_ORIENTATION=+
MMAQLETTSDTPETAPLPQPIDSDDTTCSRFRYLCQEDVQETFFPAAHHIAPNQLVWVSCSNGSKHSKKQRLFGRARIVSGDVVVETNPTTSGPETEARVQVCYPSGSNYNVKSAHLHCVLEHAKNIILVIPETDLYRRTCQIHTLPNEDFLEIGCDVGLCCKRIADTGVVLLNNCKAAPDGQNKLDARRVVGIDKSDVSIAKAKARYPTMDWFHWDAVEGSRSDFSDLESLEPDVIALDINGNRELPAVLACINAIWNRHHWKPRLIIVKSRTLHQRVRDATTESQKL